MVLTRIIKVNDDDLVEVNQNTIIPLIKNNGHYVITC